jgi:4-hydroxy-tetrahydrodipicolinate synthase
LVTPFRDGKVDFEALERMVGRQVEAGVDGLVPCGTSGESPTLTRDEHEQVIQCVIRVAGGQVPVIAGSGSNSTAHALELSRSAAEAGADGLLIVSPYYNKPTQAGLYAHFAALAKAVDVPIVLYNIPGRTGVEIAIDTICRLHADFDNIVAVKHATGRVIDAAELVQACDIDVLSGDDPLTLPLMSVGAVGVISVLSNLAPRLVKRLTQAMLDGDLERARAAQCDMFPLAKALLSLETNPIPIKTALAMRGLCAEEFRLPLCPLGAESRAKLEALLQECVLE